jgi:L-fuconolactonase
LESWQKDLENLAPFREVVYCKLSGLLTESITELNSKWRPEDIKPYLLHAIKVFGVDRLLCCSDWPVVGLAATYTQWMGVLNEVLSSLSKADDEDLPLLSKADLRKVFYENSQGCYQLETAVPKNAAVSSVYEAKQKAPPKKEIPEKPDQPPRSRL